jgi:hypothetical protein
VLTSNVVETNMYVAAWVVKVATLEAAVNAIMSNVVNTSTDSVVETTDSVAIAAGKPPR